MADNNELSRRLCDAALRTYAIYAPDTLRGRKPFPGGEIVIADPELAAEYLAAGQHAFQVNRDAAGALRLLDLALQLDPPAALLNEALLDARVEAAKALGYDEPRRAVLLYHLGLVLQHRDQWEEARQAYGTAAALDPRFVWPLNNLAWMSATTADRQAQNASLAIAAAERTCSISGWGWGWGWGWGCGCFLGTLAAAYARAGDFERAKGWQRVAVALASTGDRAREDSRLRDFQEHRAYVDLEPNPVGGAVAEEELAEFDLETVRRKVAMLIGGTRDAVH